MFFRSLGGPGLADPSGHVLIGCMHGRIWEKFNVASIATNLFFLAVSSSLYVFSSNNLGSKTYGTLKTFLLQVSGPASKTNSLEVLDSFVRRVQD